MSKSNFDLTTVDGVVGLMKTSKSGQEWNGNCDRVKAANNGDYPGFWYHTMIVSGLLTKIQMDNGW